MHRIEIVHQPPWTIRLYVPPLLREYKTAPRLTTVARPVIPSDTNSNHVGSGLVRTTPRMQPVSVKQIAKMYSKIRGMGCWLFGTNSTWISSGADTMSLVLGTEGFFRLPRLRALVDLGLPLPVFVVAISHSSHYKTRGTTSTHHVIP